jgi:hypothetical protein
MQGLGIIVLEGIYLLVISLRIKGEHSTLILSYFTKLRALIIS